MDLDFDGHNPLLGIHVQFGFLQYNGKCDFSTQASFGMKKKFYYSGLV